MEIAFEHEINWHPEAIFKTMPVRYPNVNKNAQWSSIGNPNSDTTVQLI